MYKLILLAVTGMLFFSSCKNAQEIAPTETLTFPAHFQDSLLLDSVANNNVKSWKDFFKDAKLRTLIDSALTRNFDVQTAYSRLDRALGHAKLYRGSRLPDLGLQAGASVRKYGDYTMDGVGNYDTQFSTNINADQMIPDPYRDYLVGAYTSWELDIYGKLRNAKQSALSQILAARHARDFVLTNTVSEVAKNYYRLIMLDRQIEILEENIAIQENALSLVQAQKESGRTTELAVEMITAQVLNSQATLIELKDDIIETETVLNLLLGRVPQKIDRNKFEYTNLLVDNVNLSVHSDVLMKRPDIREAEESLRAAKLDVRAAKKAFYPSININANLGYQAMQSRLVFDPASLAFQLAAGLAAPLVNQRGLKSNYAKSVAEKQIAYVAYNKTVITGFTEVYRLVRRIGNTNQIVDLKKQEAAVLRNSIETSLSLFSLGRANYFEVITTQKNSIAADFDLLHMIYNQTEAYISLYKAIGGGID